MIQKKNNTLPQGCRGRLFSVGEAVAALGRCACPAVLGGSAAFATSFRRRCFVYSFARFAVLRLPLQVSLAFFANNRYDRKQAAAGALLRPTPTAHPRKRKKETLPWKPVLPCILTKRSAR